MSGPHASGPKDAVSWRSGADLPARWAYLRFETRKQAASLQDRDNDRTTQDTRRRQRRAWFPIFPELSAMPYGKTILPLQAADRYGQEQNGAGRPEMA